MDQHPAEVFARAPCARASLCAFVRQSAASTNCTACPLGRYSAGGSNPCNNCNQGKVANSNASACVCSPGYDGTNCVACMSGKFSPGNGAPCATCPGGTYANTTAAVACIECVAGTNSTGAAVPCAACPLGRYSLAVAPSCTVCPAGSYNLATGQSSCITCAAGVRAGGGVWGPDAGWGGGGVCGVAGEGEGGWWRGAHTRRPSQHGY
jgi:hypothetical protein